MGVPYTDIAIDYIAHLEEKVDTSFPHWYFSVNYYFLLNWYVFIVVMMY